MVHVLIVVMLIRSDAKHVAMAAVHIDVLMFSIRHMGMRMTQGRQHQADTHEQAKHADQRGHRAECKRSTRRVAMFRALPAAFSAELTFTLGEYRRLTIGAILPVGTSRHGAAMFILRT